MCHRLAWLAVAQGITALVAHVDRQIAISVAPMNAVEGGLDEIPRCKEHHTPYI